MIESDIKNERVGVSMVEHHMRITDLEKFAFEEIVRPYWVDLNTPEAIEARKAHEEWEWRDCPYHVGSLSLMSVLDHLLEDSKFSHEAIGRLRECGVWRIPAYISHPLASYLVEIGVARRIIDSDLRERMDWYDSIVNNAIAFTDVGDSLTVVDKNGSHPVDVVLSEDSTRRMLQGVDALGGAASVFIVEPAGTVPSEDTDEDAVDSAPSDAPSDASSDVDNSDDSVDGDVDKTADKTGSREQSACYTMLEIRRVTSFTDDALGSTPMASILFPAKMR